MKYISTRGRDFASSIDDVLKKGIADDGGLFLPESLCQKRAAQGRRQAGGMPAQAWCTMRLERARSTQLNVIMQNC